MPSKVPFRVIHASGQDDHHKAVELNTHSPLTRGWNSSRFCLYPQDIVVQLDTRCRLRKLQILAHQFLIATKIEFYVGDVPPNTTPSLNNARYTRLGYVALSDNEKTGYKARELKSVHIDAMGHFVKFVIHKNHVNRHNLYNQVGIVALNVLGDPIDKDDLDIQENPNDLDQLLSGINKPDYISPLDDLAFDMYQDPEIAQIIRKLEHRKQDAVLKEKYDYAKKVKSCIQDLQKVGEKLGKYEVEKRQAVENEDYDRAQVKKLQMDEYRLQVYKQLEVNHLLDEPLTNHNKPQEPVQTHRARSPPNVPETARSPVMPVDSPRGGTPPPLTPYDDRPLPAIKHKSSPTKDQTVEEHPLPSSSSAAEGDRTDRGPTPIIDSSDVPTEETGGNVTGEPEPMTEKDMREAASAIDVFGLPLVSKDYSKNWSFREDALLEVYKTMSKYSEKSPREDARNMMRAAILLVNRAIKDKVFAVFTAGLNLLKMILTDFIPKHKIQKQDTVYALEKTLPSLMLRTGDTASRIRDSSKNFIIEESKFPEVKSTHHITTECVKPFKLNMAPRLAFNRTEVVEQLYKIHSIHNSGLTVENVMKFCGQAIQHTSGEVREKAEHIIILLYGDAGAPVKDYLPPDDEKTRKNVLYKQLFMAFDKIDGKPSKGDIKDDEKKKQAEVEALQQQLQQLRNMAANKNPQDDKSKPKDKKEKKPRAKTQPTESEPKPPLNTEHLCIFCGERNEKFTEEGLDLHYWKSCPMLQRCAYCNQVVDISGLTEHLLSECDKKKTFRKCNRCSEAVSQPDYDQHMAELTCIPSEGDKARCPLCHMNIAKGEESWKQHLMGRDGCKANTRRLQALNKGKGGGAKPTPRGKGSQVKAANKSPRK